MKKWKKFLIVSLSFLFVVTSVLAGLVNFVKVDDTSNNSGNQNQESGVITPSSPDNYDGMIYYASESEETGALEAPRETKGGAIYVDNGSTLEIDGGLIAYHECLYGGAIYVANGGTCTMTGGTIEYNYSMYGGAVYVEAGGTFIIEDGDIINNMSENAPAIYVEAGGHVKISADAYIVANEYIEVQDTMINYYVDGEYVYSRNQLLPAFNLGNVPLDYENCNGYFLDEGMTIPVEQNDDITTLISDISIQSMVGKNTSEDYVEYNLYTHTATPELFNFTLVDDTHYSVTKKAGSVATKYVLPKTYENKNVDTLSVSMFRGDTNIETLYISSLIKKLSESLVRETTNFKNINFTKNIDTMASSVFMDSSITNIYIPSYTSLTAIGKNAFRGCAGLTEMIIPECITDIGYYSFYGCASLTEIIIPENVTSIGYSAFRGCTGLTEITVPENVTSFGTWVFAECTGLVELNYNANITTDFVSSDKIFYNCGSDNGFTVNINSSYLPAYFLYGNTKVTAVNITDKLTSVTGYAFNGCTALETVNTGGNITTIGNYAFSKCSSLINITNLLKVNSIDSNAFKNCTSLESFELSNVLTSIGSSAFLGCTGLTEITIPTSVTSIGNSSFSGCSGLLELNYNANVTTNFTTDSNIFKGAGSDNGFTVNINSSYLPAYFLYSNTKVTAVNITDKLTSVTDYSFSGCTALETVNTGGNITTIGNYAFYKCSSLINITNLLKINKIGDYSFKNCTSLDSMSVGGYIEIGGHAFESAGIKSFTYSGYIESLGYGAFLNSGLTSIDIKMYSTPGSSAFKGCTALKEVNCDIQIEDDSIISSYMFSGCTSLETVNIESGYDYHDICESEEDCYNAVSDISYKTYIDSFAFYNCTSLKSITIPSSVYRLRTHAFEGCTSLTTVNYKKGKYYYYRQYPELHYEELLFVEIENLTQIDAWAFKGCTALTSITLPERIEIIRTEAFKDTSISSVTIPYTCYMVGKCAFANDKLESVTFESTSGWYFSNADYGSETTAEQGTSANVSSPTANAQLMKDMASGEKEQKHFLKKPVV